MRTLFDQLYLEFGRELHAYLFGRTGSKETADDLLQDIFLRVWNRMDIVKPIPPNERRYWLFSAAANRVTDYYRHAAVKKKATEKLILQHKLDRTETSNTEQAVTAREQYRELEKAIRELPEELRTILLMHSVGGMSSSKIGEAIRIPAGTVRYKLSLARRSLASKLNLFKQDTLERKEG